MKSLYIPSLTRQNAINRFRMTEMPISKPDKNPEFIVNGKKIKTHAELEKEEYLKVLLSPKLKYGSGSISVSSGLPYSF